MSPARTTDVRGDERASTQAINHPKRPMSCDVHRRTQRPGVPTCYRREFWQSVAKAINSHLTVNRTADEPSEWRSTTQLTDRW